MLAWLRLVIVRVLKRLLIILNRRWFSNLLFYMNLLQPRAVRRRAGRAGGVVSALDFGYI